LGITEHNPGEVFEKVINHLAATHEWSRVRIPTSRGSDRVEVAKQSSRKSSKSNKKKSLPPEPEVIPTEPVKLHYLIDRRDFLEKVKSVYASYAG